MDRPDEFLVSASRKGAQDAFATLVHRHLKRVFAICLGILRDVSDAEDAAQEVFLRAYERIGDLRDGGRFSSWINQIARNRCRDILRQQRRRPDRAPTATDEDPTTDRVSQYEDLQEALSRLPEESRLALLLYYYDGKDTQTLARELGLTQGGACTRLFRARNQLRKLLAGGGDGS
jgi:RNA polymerase sigma-70 factor (ECF subfamily)